MVFSSFKIVLIFSSAILDGYFKFVIAVKESHNEERLMVKAPNYIPRSEDYDIKQKETALERVKLPSAFYYIYILQYPFYNILSYKILLNPN